MVYSKDMQNKEGAQEFLNYICSDEPAQLNFEYVYYASPIQSVIDSQDEETERKMRRLILLPICSKTVKYTEL